MLYEVITLGSNSLLDLVVFGKSTGEHIAKTVQTIQSHKPLPKDAGENTLARLARYERAEGENLMQVRLDMRQVMQENCGVFRFPDLLEKGAEESYNFV